MTELSPCPCHEQTSHDTWDVGCTRPRTTYDVLQDFREACHWAEVEEGLDTQGYDIAMAKAFKAAASELKMRDAE